MSVVQKNSNVLGLNLTSSTTDLVNTLDTVVSSLAPKADPVFTGTVTTPALTVSQNGTGKVVSLIVSNTGKDPAWSELQLNAGTGFSSIRTSGLGGGCMEIQTLTAEPIIFYAGRNTNTGPSMVINNVDNSTTISKLNVSTDISSGNIKTSGNIISAGNGNILNWCCGVFDGTTLAIQSTYGIVPFTVSRLGTGYYRITMNTAHRLGSAYVINVSSGNFINRILVQTPNYFDIDTRTITSNGIASSNDTQRVYFCVP
jgi:hypothetical protein